MKELNKCSHCTSSPVSFSQWVQFYEDLATNDGGIGMKMAVNGADLDRLELHA
jgi:hypothetical protein